MKEEFRPGVIHVDNDIHTWITCTGSSCVVRSFEGHISEYWALSHHGAWGMLLCWTLRIQGRCCNNKTVGVNIVEDSGSVPWQTYNSSFEVTIHLLQLLSHFRKWTWIMCMVHSLHYLLQLRNVLWWPLRYFMFKYSTPDHFQGTD